MSNVSSTKTKCPQPNCFRGGILIEHDAYVACDRCNGDGYIYKDSDEDNLVKTCRDCMGRGYNFDNFLTNKE